MSLNKFTCERVKYAFNYDFYSVGDNQAEFKSGKSFTDLFSDSVVTFIEKTSKINGNDVTQQELTISINESEFADLGQLSRNEFILLLSRNDGSEFLWGNLTIPVEALMENRANSQVEIRFFRTTTDLAVWGIVTIT